MAIADITRAELGLGLFLGYLITPKEKRVIGEIYVPEVPKIEIPKVRIRSLELGVPVIDLQTCETPLGNTEYQKVLDFDVPEGFKLSLESLSILPVTNPNYAKYRFKFDTVTLEEKDVLASLTLPFRGRTELEKTLEVWLRSTSATNQVKSQASLIGILLPKVEGE